VFIHHVYSMQLNEFMTFVKYVRTNCKNKLERVLISFCFQPNPPVIYCVYVECIVVIK